MHSSKQLLSILAISGGLALSGVALADSSRHYNSSSAYDDHTAWATVTRVEPMLETVEVNQPREECRTDRVAREVPVYSHGSRSQRAGRSYTPEILGAVIGGAVGRKAGRGRGQDVATVVGAVLGGSIGRDIGRNHRHNRHTETRYETRYEDVRRCETVDNYHTEERIIGYRVQYTYDGRSYWTRTDTDPGNRIRVRVSVQPVS